MVTSGVAGGRIFIGGHPFSVCENEETNILLLTLYHGFGEESTGVGLVAKYLPAWVAATGQTLNRQRKNPSGKSFFLPRGILYENYNVHTFSNVW
jgi:hypothetical protein